MTIQTTRYPTLAPAILSDSTLARNILLVVSGVALLTISAKIKIPFHPVPMTMQTFVVLALGMVYGWKIGALTTLGYLFTGALGLAVFAGTPEKGIGIVYMMGPTGGYLIGFVLAAAVTGLLAERGWDRKLATTFLAMVIGNIVIYIPGLLWMGSLLGWDKPILDWGLTPFLWGDLMKIVLAVAVLPGAWKIVNKIRTQSL